MSEKKVRIPRGKAQKALTFPCMQTRMVPIEKVISNSYNPNEVASEEMILLIESCS